MNAHTLLSYGVSLAAFLGFGTWEAKRRGLDGDRWSRLVFGCFLAGVLGGRVGFIATNWEHYAADPLALVRIWQGGTLATTVLVGSIAFFVGYTARARMPRWQTLDVIACSLALGWGVHLLADIPLGFSARIGADAMSGVVDLGVIVLLMTVRKTFAVPGQALLALGFFMGAERVLKELLFPPEETVMLGPISTSMFIGLAVFVVSSAAFVFRHARDRPAT